MELWGGHECTVNRIGDRFRDQTVLTGHQDRADDLDRFAALGLRRLRYPVLWERIAPDRPDTFDWRWTDERLARIAALGMEPIAGLVHHGSGPSYTSLVSDDFAPLLGDFAAAAARRYGHVEHWTPVNEPLTTARFSALYGHWYPHAADDRSFWLALLNQIDATRFAMRAIRTVNPAAKLIQTEDLGRTYATEPLRWLADFYNDRRWISWDLLAGRVLPGHPMWEEIGRFGFADRLRAIADDPCPPDLLGVNHYVTSERFLDHRIADYSMPAPDTGYHDLTAARVLDPPPAGLRGVLTEAWERYAIPLAVTESHLGCTREEQMRWIWQSWHDCLRLRDEGVDVRALTAWALIGNVDWSSLLTREAGHYEPGAFDVRGPVPRATAIAGLLAALGGRGEPIGNHPALASPGWWKLPRRLEHRAVAWDSPTPAGATAITPPRGAERPLLIAGSGSMAHAIAGGCELRGLSHHVVGPRALPSDDPDRVALSLDDHRPWAVIDATGADGNPTLASACAARGIHYTLISPSDAAEDGTGRLPADALLIRTGAPFSPYDQSNIAIQVEHALRQRRRFPAPTATGRPTYVPDLVATTLDLVLDGESGAWDLSGEAVSGVEFAKQVAEALGLDPGLVVEGSADDAGWRTPTVASARGGQAMLPPLADALARHAAVRLAAQDWATERAA